MSFGLLGALLATMATIAGFAENGQQAVKAIAPFSLIAIACFVTAYVYTGTHLKATSDGIEVKKSFSKPKFVSWHEMDEIGIATVPYWSKGREDFHQYVGIRLSDGSSRKNSEECAANRKLCGFDVLLIDAYGMSLDELAAFLRKKRSRAINGPKFVSRKK